MRGWQQLRGQGQRRVQKVGEQWKPLEGEDDVEVSGDGDGDGDGSCGDQAGADGAEDVKGCGE